MCLFCQAQNQVNNFANISILYPTSRMDVMLKTYTRQKFNSCIQCTGGVNIHKVTFVVDLVLCALTLMRN